jgi:hypothetical protein
VRVQYTGLSDKRIITSADFPNIEDDFADLIWTPKEVLETRDDVGSYLTTYHRQEFKEYEEPEELPVWTKEVDRAYLEELDRDALVEEAARRGVTHRAKATKLELVDLMIGSMLDDESPDDESVDPD